MVVDNGYTVKADLYANNLQYIVGGRILIFHGSLLTIKLAPQSEYLLFAYAKTKT